MKLKKTLSILLGISLLSSLTACKGIEDFLGDLYIEPTTTPTETTTTQPSTGTTNPVTTGTTPTTNTGVTPTTNTTTTPITTTISEEDELRYGYLDLDRSEKKDVYKSFYQEVYERLSAFDSSNRNITGSVFGEGEEAETLYQIETITIKNVDINAITHVETEKSYGLEFSEASAILKLVELDHPEFYYMCGTVRATSSTFMNNAKLELLIFVDEEYKDASTRAALKTELNNFRSAIESTFEATDNEKTKVRKIHDYIKAHATYAFLADGVTPDDSNEAHNLMGIVHSGKGVCESYSELFTYLLKSFGINGITATGQGITSSGSGGHAWNLVEIDGKFYGFDVTWNDSTGTDKYYGISKTKLEADHVVTVNDFDYGINYLYAMPTISSTDLS